MDLALSTSLANLPTLAFYRGQSCATNHPPANSSNLRAQIIGTNAVLLAWDRATDPEQPGGLTYNVRVGTAPGLGDVLSPMSLTDGFRLVPRIGNAGWSTNRLLAALQSGATYYWSVQAVDNSFAGGSFAPEASFTLPAASLTFNAVSAAQLELELRAAPNTAWRLEASSDLKYWSDYPAAEASTQTGTNGLSWIRVTPLSSHRFYRAKQMQ
jgi:hypothetical protein